MTATFFFQTIPFSKGAWIAESNQAVKTACDALGTLLKQHGIVALTGDHTPIDRFTYDGTRVVAHDTHGNHLTVYVLGTLAQAVETALSPLIANHFFLAKGLTHQCVLQQESFLVLVDGHPYATLQVQTEGASLDVLGTMPPWTFTFQGTPSKMIAHWGPSVVDQILKQQKKDAPRFVLMDEETRQWYAGYDLAFGTDATLLHWVTTPEKAYSWVRMDDVLVHAMALEGLYAFHWRRSPTQPGWENAA